MSMNVCPTCSTVLTSDGQFWKCRYELVDGAFKPHPQLPARRDKRTTTLANREAWVRRAGRLY